jgi:hypothetical protein
METCCECLRTQSDDPDAWGIYPYDMLRRAWEYVMFLLGVFTIWSVIYEWVLEDDLSTEYLVPSLIIDVFFVVDIFVVTRTGYIDHGVMRLDRESIRAHYPRWRFIYGWIYPWPYYLIGYIARVNIVYLIFMTLKLMRLLRLYEAYHVIRTHLVYISAKSHMFTLVLILLTVIHLFACLAWLLGHFEHEKGVMHNWLDEFGLIDCSTFEQYFRLYYFMLSTVTTIGYGDIHAVTVREMLFVIFCELVGVFIYQYIVSSFVVILTDPSRQRFLAKFQRVYRTFRSRGLSDQALTDLLRYYEYIWEHDRNREFFYENTRRLMPDGLQKRIHLAIHLSLFSGVRSLQGVEEAVLEKIAIALHPRIFTPGDIIAKAGHTSKSLFFITRGQVQAITGAGTLVNAFDGRNTAVLAERSIVERGTEACTYIAETYVEAFELTAKDYERITATECPSLLALRRGLHRVNAPAPAQNPDPGSTTA